MGWLTGGAFAITVTLSAAFGQPAPPAFEVASIRVHDGPLSRIFDFSSSGPRATLVAYPPRGLIMEACNMKNYQVSFGPSVSLQDNIYYDIVAKAAGSRTPTKNEFRQMLQTLLAERFNLKIHREMKEMPVYALVVEKNGPKFKESAPDAGSSWNHGVNGRNQTVTASKYTMERVVNDIQGYFGLDRPVLDRTGLTGAYDIKMEATPEYRLNREPQPGDISVFTAVQAQLGLKLEAQKGMIEILVVDRWDKPSAN